ncbi:hypothetical protein BDL97_01G088300 [Sphagnum fallax]|nr:hypothetical protein BDL97_01G088300 [Sphagnum fallax]
MALFTTCKLCMASVSSREVVSCANLSTSPSDVPSLLLKCSGAFVAAPVESFGGRRSCRLENGARIYYRPNLESMFESSRSRMVVKKTTTAKLIRASSAEVVNGNSSCEGYLPKAEFYKVEAILRPWRLPHVATALIKMGIRGVTVTDVKGFGAQGGSRERQAGSEFCEEAFVVKVKLEIVVSQDQVESVIDTIIDEARTGEIGDGKIFVSPVADIIRVRTGERGRKAERMTGGRADILSTYTSSNNI